MATILYDAEVFPHNWLMGFKIVETGEYIQIWDDFNELQQFIENNKRDSFFIGFNSGFYDDVILETLLKKKNPYPISCALIDRGEKIKSYMKLNRMDIMEGMASGTSLKTIESELGMSIEETQVDFHTPRPLTDDEKEQTNFYNRHDLDATEKLLEKRWSNFVKTKMDLIKYFNLPPAMMRKPFATMVATGLGAKRTSHPPRKFEWYPNLKIENEDVKKFIIEEKFLHSNLIFEIDGVEHKMGLGGLHGAREAYKSDYFWKVDVKGYYSLIQMNLDLLSRSLPPEGKAAYKKLYDDRLERKAKKDPSADSLKAAVLAVWGATLNQYQLLSDITTGNLIMITGQAFIIDLLEKLEPYSTLIQTNTDGIFIEPLDEEMCNEVIREWVERTGFEVEIEKGSKLYQKDVNNYVCLIEGDEIVAKGSYVNLYKMQDDEKFFQFKLTYNQSQGTIMDKAVVNYFIYDIPVEETVNNETNPRSFMFTVKKGARTYSHVELHELNKATQETTVKVMGKVNRVFASKDPNFERRLYKIKNGNPNIYPNMDVNIFVFNKDLSEFTEEDMNRIDREYYIRRANERIQDFITPKPQKVKKVKEIKIKVRLWDGLVKAVNKQTEDEMKQRTEQSAAEQIVETLNNRPNGLFRYGDMTINKMGDWFTFVEKRGKTTVLNKEKITPEIFDIKFGKLNKKKIQLDKNKKFFEIFETDMDALVIYTDKKNPDESFEFRADSFEEAINQLSEMGLIEPEQAEEAKPVEKEVKRSSGKSKETIQIDDENHITYESYDIGSGTEWEVGWFKKGLLVKKVDVLTIDEALDVVEKWMLEYYDAN